MIPAFTPEGNLPPGIITACWPDVVARFGDTPWRLELLDGLLKALWALREAGCSRAFIDGSFVTAKPEPGDFDACWDVTGVDAGRLDPVFLDFRDGRAAQKARFRGELFPAHFAADEAGTMFIDFFQRDRRTGAPKGIVVIDLSDLP